MTKIDVVVVLLFSDGVMCGMTGVSWIIQRLVFLDYIDWNRSGWVLQNVSFYLGSCEVFLINMDLVRYGKPFSSQV